ncbi:MAG TPA: Vms1/Ankzf1 family peptidyl-tRNA hydrolase [Thermoleophilaceae bacterium]
MQTNELRPDRLRELAVLRPEGARVLSVFLNLDPAEFAEPPARASEIRSAIDELRRLSRETDGLDHDAKVALRADVDRISDFLSSFSPKGAHGVVVYACGPADLFEVIRLPRPIETRAVIDDSPLIEPLAELIGAGSWLVVLVNRQTGRMFLGDRERLEEIDVIVDDVHGQHKQGGWSQARYQRSVDEDVQDHLRGVAEAAFVHFKRAPFDNLLLGGPQETLSDFEPKLHAYLKERVAGRVDVDVENSSADDVRSAAAAKIEEHERRREREALDRLQEGISTGGRGAAGLEDVLEALNERRVETLLLDPGFHAAGCTCPQCGWVGPPVGGACPADGTPVESRDDVVESAVELAMVQNADVLVVRDEDNQRELQSHGQIGALLRF